MVVAVHSCTWSVVYRGSPSCRLRSSKQARCLLRRALLRLRGSLLRLAAQTLQLLDLQQQLRLDLIEPLLVTRETRLDVVEYDDGLSARALATTGPRRRAGLACERGAGLRSGWRKTCGTNSPDAAPPLTSRSCA